MKKIIFIFLVIYYVSANAQQPDFINKGLVVYWPFDNSGSDSSVNKINATIHGCSFTEGLKGDCLFLNNQSHNRDNYVSSEKTVENFITSNTNQTICFFAKFNDFKINGERYGWLTKLMGTNSLWLRFENTSGEIWSNGWDINNKLYVGLNNWAFICYVQRADSLFFYINDNLFSSTRGGGVRPSTCSYYGLSKDIIVIGEQYVNLYIDEFRVYNRALNSDEIYLLKGYMSGEITSLNTQSIEEYISYRKAIKGSYLNCDTYLKNYPKGKYISKVKTAKEVFYYQKAVAGIILDCDKYIQNYPTGSFISEIKILKTYRQTLITNSNKANWKLGCKLCATSNNGIICGVLNQWNEDKSSFLIKIVTSPGGEYGGENLIKNNTIWLPSANTDWHICFPNEIQESLDEDRSDPTKDYSSYRSWTVGKNICISGKKGWLQFDFKVIAQILAWNEDKSKVFVKIIQGDDVVIPNVEKLYTGNTLWLDPSIWKLCY